MQKNTCSESADQRRDNHSGKEANKLNAHNVWIDGKSERRSAPGTKQSEDAGSDCSRPQRVDINVK
jgi:hypothetical protein